MKLINLKYKGFLIDLNQFTKSEIISYNSRGIPNIKNVKAFLKISDKDIEHYGKNFFNEIIRKTETQFSNAKLKLSIKFARERWKFKECSFIFDLSPLAETLLEMQVKTLELNMQNYATKLYLQKLKQLRFKRKKKVKEFDYEKNIEST